MMTKYQLVFLRLETSMKKLLQNEEARKRMRLKRGFYAFKRQHEQGGESQQSRQRKMAFAC